MLNGLDLFSGIGGMASALDEWVTPIAYCEIDRYCQAVLLSRMSEGKITLAPIWNDVRSLSANQFDGKIAIHFISGGFPCQDISVAGHGEGLEGKRSGLFFEIIRLVKELGPEYVFLENVPNVTTKGGIRIISEFAAMGYDCRWTMVSAAEIGASFWGVRWFLLAKAKSQRSERLVFNKTTRASFPGTPNSYLSKNWEEMLDKFPRVVDGIPYPSHRIKALGNAVVPIQAREAFIRLMGIKQS